MGEDVLGLVFLTLIAGLVFTFWGLVECSAGLFAIGLGWGALAIFLVGYLYREMIE